MDDGKSDDPKLPIPGKRNILITSALPYVNNVPHLGNIIGCVLSADVYARYCRLRDYNAIYICGTDEYGTATETKAVEEHCTPKEICDKYHAIHKEVYDWFDISFDKFGRTSTPQHTQVCQAIFNKLSENKYLSEDTMQQLYCDKCEKLLADRLVEGSCPIEGCSNDAARGDQCDKCGKLLNPTELKDPRCKVCRAAPRNRDIDHLFIELPSLKDKLEEYINKTSVTGSWSQNAIQTTNAWLKEGLKRRCITRDLKWGVPVPHEKYKDKVFYVLFDAPIGYVSITSSYTSAWKKWWKNPENVELYQFMAEDNLPLHTVMFPSTQLGTGENWTLMKTISVTKYINYEGVKFSKNKGVGVFGNDVKDTNIPVEVWRYYLLTNRPEVSDTSFKWGDLQAKLTGELVGSLGNFINRVLSFIAKPENAGYGSIIPDAPGAESHPQTMLLGEKVGKLVEEYIKAMEKVKLKQGLKTAMVISSEGNRYLQKNQFWKLYREDKPSCAVVIRSAAGLVHLLAQLLEPFMPSFSREVFKQLKLQPHFSLSDKRGDVSQASRPWEILPPSHRIGTPQPLFKELNDEEIKQYKQIYARSQADRRGRDARAMEDGKSDDPKLPIPGKRNILITSALPYINNVPRLGNIICVLSADVYARYCRLRDYNAIYICGTDEYGTATETKAVKEHCTPKEICDKYHAIHKEVYDWFDISFDKFGRTSTPQHTQVCQAIFNKLSENKYLSEDTMQQLYCDACEKFLADRLVEGSCPIEGCSNDAARGDQCDKCGKLLNPTDLKDPRCNVCRTTPRIRDTDHLFIDLPSLKDKLEEYINKTSSVTGSWSQNAIQTTNAWLKEGLKQRCITRDLKWGVPVPHEEYKDKVFYVWFDAPIGYVSITSSYTSEWRKWWMNPENVELYQFMGKDNVPFHTVMFPSTQLGTGENWTLMKTISVTEYLNYEGGKFSKSLGIGVFGNDVKDTNIPVEVWRYYLLTNRPEVSDASFEWKDLQAKVNGELVSNLGNFVNRVLSFIAKPENAGYGSIIPDAPGAESHLLTMSLGEKVGKLVEEYIETMEKVKLKQGLKTAMLISAEGNRYLQENQFWKLYKEDKPSCAVVIRSVAGLVHLLAQLLEPFMPSFSREVFKQLNLPPHFSLSDERGDVSQASRPWEILPPSHRIGTPQPLFKELKDKDIEVYQNKYAGSQADRLAREAKAGSRRSRRDAASSRRHAEAVANLGELPIGSGST